jgi:hypothetical protein
MVEFVVPVRLLLLNVRWDTGTRWRRRGGVSNTETMGLSDGAVEGTDLLETPAAWLAWFSTTRNERNLLRQIVALLFALCFLFKRCQTCATYHATIARGTKTIDV